MSPRSLPPLCFALAALLAAAARAADLPPETFPLDPVALVDGRELPGDESISVVRGSYRYVFADEAARAAFLARPEAYEIQLGGACARMGPLSGRGSVALHAVHDGRVYLFASESCRKTFLADPGKRLEGDDPVPAATPDASARGAELLARVVDALGGAAALDAAGAFVLEEVGEQEYGGAVYEVGYAWRIDRGQGTRLESWWEPGYRRADVATPEDAFTASGDGSRPLDASQRRALLRAAAHLPLVALQARGRPDFSALAAGTDRVGEQAAERLLLFADGAATTLLVEPGTGRLLGEEFTGRGPDASMGTVRLVFTETVAAGGLLVPSAWTATFDGRPADDLARRFGTVEVSRALDPSLFAR